MALSRQVLDDIRARVDIVDLIGSYVTLKRAGASYKGLCPFHREKTPSFTVHPARQVFHCFGCGKGGDVFKFVMEHEGVQFMDAVRLLAQRAGVEVRFTEAERGEETRKDLLYTAHAEAAKFYNEVLLKHPSAKEARAYLKARDLGLEVIEQFGLGYAPGGFEVMERFAEKRGFSLEMLETAGLIAKNESGRRYDRFRERLMFPIRDLTGRVIAFSGRILGKDERAAKYLNSPETPLFRKSRALFAMDRARKAIIDAQTCILCEGQIDVIRCHTAGFTNAVAALGTALTEEHAALIKRHADRVVLVMDADSAGQNSALRSAEIFLGAELAVEIATLPTGEDPDSLISKQGPDAFRAVLEQARSVVDFQMDVLSTREDMKQEAGLRRVAAAVLETIRHSASEVQRAQMLREAAARLGLSEQTLRTELRRTARARPVSPPKNAPGPAAEPLPTPPPREERELLWLLVKHPEVMELIQRYLIPEHLSDQRCRALYVAICNHEERDDLLAAARNNGEACVQFAAEVIADERSLGDDTELQEKAARELVISVRRKGLEREIQSLTRQRASAPPEDQGRFTDEIATRKYELVALRQGWEKAALVLEI